MKIDTTASSRFLAQGDVDAPFIATIDRVKIDNALRNPYVLTFVEAWVKPLPLNLTNRRMIVAAYGEDSDHWTGKPIEIYVNPDVTNSRGEIVGGIRLRIPAAVPAPPSRPTSPPPPARPPAKPTTPRTEAPAKPQAPAKPPAQQQGQEDLAAKHARALMGITQAETMDSLNQWRQWTQKIAFTHEQWAELDAAFADRMNDLTREPAPTSPPPRRPARQSA